MKNNEIKINKYEVMWNCLYGDILQNIIDYNYRIKEDKYSLEDVLYKMQNYEKNNLGRTNEK